VDLETVAAELAPRLIAYAFARTRCRATAEDVAQDALVALVSRWRRLGPPESPEAFVFAIARRRAGRASLRRALLSPLDWLSDTPVAGGSIDDAYEQRAELAAVFKGLRTLARRDREVLLLRAIGELDLAAIAAVTGSSEGAVKMRLHRARRRLRLVLEQQRAGRSRGQEGRSSAEKRSRVSG
jgi:RNA polymerase sigma-70 factor (ECF subfamily)